MLGFEVYSHLKKTSNVLKSVWTRRWREECSSFGQLQLVIVGGVVVECGSFVEVDSVLVQYLIMRWKGTKYTT